MTNVNKLSQR